MDANIYYNNFIYLNLTINFNNIKQNLILKIYLILELMFN